MMFGPTKRNRGAEECYAIESRVTNKEKWFLLTPTFGRPLLVRDSVSHLELSESYILGVASINKYLHEIGFDYWYLLHVHNECL